MKKLIIRAHPKSENGYNLAITKSIHDACITAGHTVTIIDLYKEYSQPFLTFTRGEDIPHQKKIQQLITEHDELIFVFPIRWVDCPAILKNFFDINMSRGFGYTTNEKGKQIKLLTGKKARIVASAGGPAFFYPFIWFITWTMGRFGFCGIKHVSTNIISHVMTCSDQKRKNFLEKVSKICSR